MGQWTKTVMIQPGETLNVNNKIELIHSFEPIVGDAPRILILGSLPGPMSLKRGEYYAHPQNHFWKLIACILEQESASSYAEKVDMLKKNKIALWDSIEIGVKQICAESGVCAHTSALDQDIKYAVPNDLDGFLDANPTIAFVCFNGKKAEQVFNRHFGARAGIEHHLLPSSSPAHANKDKPALWRNLLRELLDRQ